MSKNTMSRERNLYYEDLNSEWADRTGPNPELRNIHLGERRSAGDRRGDAPTQRRKNEVDGRSGKDRRILRIGVCVRLNWSSERMADWLEQNCRGRWSMALSDIDRQQGDQEINVMFERQADADQFIRIVAARGGEIV